MHLPPHADVSLEMVGAAGKSHSLTTGHISRLPDTGIFNAVYLLGDEHILRIPRHHHAHYQALANESVAVPLARGAGVRTPSLLVYDDSRDVLPVPYTIYERVHGETLGHLDLEPEEAPEVWRELGRDLARLHTGVGHDGPGAAIAALETLPDPPALAQDLAEGGWITASEARWLTHWLARLAPAALNPAVPRLLHGDTQATNVMVSPGSHRYLAVLDWGSAGWGDPAWDFAGIPLRAVPFLLEGYREIATAEDALEPRILWRHIQLALFTARREPQPAHSWAERPLPMLMEIARFFLADPPPPWRELRPG